MIFFYSFYYFESLLIYYKSFTITSRPHLTCVILITSLIYAMYNLCHICLFPCNMLVLGFCVFIHTFCIFNHVTFNSKF